MRTFSSTQCVTTADWGYQKVCAYDYDRKASCQGLRVNGGELGDLPFTGLIGSGDPGVDGGALSQLNPPGFAVGNRLIFLVRYMSKTYQCSTGTTHQIDDADRLPQA